MTGEPFEYAIKKDVRNNPIVREVDRERHREMWRAVGIGVFLVFAALVYAWQHFELLQHGYRLEEMQRDLATAAERHRHLRLELETLRSPARIEAIALRQLRMQAPSPQDATVIQRVAPPPAPSAAVLARR